MEVIPAIDLVDGRVVRLVQGRFDAVTPFDDAPEELAQRFAALGARWLHVVDLDAARTGRRDGANAEIVARLQGRKRTALQVGGGFRSEDDVEEALAGGIDRVLVGTLAVREPEALGRLAERHGARVCVTADSLEGRARIEGWLEDSGEPTVALVRRLADIGVGAFLVTAIDRDGTLAGPDLRLLGAVREATDGILIASGGIGSLDDVRRAGAIGCDAVVVGKAILTGAVGLGEALAVGRAVERAGTDDELG